MQSFFQTNLQKQPSEVFYKKSCLKKIANFSEKHLCKSLFLIELQAFKMDYFNNNESWKTATKVFVIAVFINVNAYVAKTIHTIYNSHLCVVIKCSCKHF